MLQARLGRAAVARLAQIERAHTLRERGLDPLPLRVEAPSFRRALACPGRGEGLVLAPRQERQHAAIVSRTRPGAAGARGAVPAVGGPELDADRKSVV